MAELNIKEVRAMAYDLYKGRTSNFSAEEANEAIKNIILEAGGCKEEWDMYKFQENKFRVFRIMKEILTPIVSENVVDRYNSWVEIHDVALGDTMVFEVMNQDLFKIGYVADGTSELRRQNLVNGKLAMTHFQLGAKIYCEFDEFRRGRINFAQWIDRLGLSFEVEIGRIIVKAMENAYTGLKAEYQVSGALDDAKLQELVARVEGKTGKQAVIYGTKFALAKLRASEGHDARLAEIDKEAISRKGYIETYYGTRLVELPQVLDRDDKFMLADDILFVIPDGTKIVKLLFEGDVDVIEVNNPATRMDMQFEYMFMRRLQLGVCQASVFGAYKLS